MLDRTVLLEPPVDWSSVNAPALWRYNLNYFGFLGSIAAGKREALCLDWIRQNKPFKAIGWDAYPTSLRLINWIKHAPHTEEILSSLFVHAEYLSRNLETHLLGNHLLENARALVFAGTFFTGQPDAERWLRLGLRVYRRQLPEQVLSDGGHFERSPMYHALMLEGCADVANLLPEDHSDTPMFCDVATRMTTFLDGLLHPDGEISLFNDSAFDVAPDPRQLAKYARTVASSTGVTKVGMAAPLGLSIFPETGYCVFRGEQMFVAIDCGPVGPDHLPAHAHADIFSYELSRAEQRWIVDSGTYEYEPGEMRDYCRSTRAHNTVQVDGTDQVEVYGSFRVGRRDRPYGVNIRRDEGSFDFSGTYPGYGRLLGDDIRVRRSVRGTEDQLVVVDRIDGHGTHRVSSFVHLHPAVEVERVDDFSLRLARDSEQCILSSSDVTVALEKGWYCPSFGVREENTVAVFSREAALPVTLGYTLKFKLDSGA